MIREILDVYAYDQLRRGPRPDAGDGDEAFVRSVPARSAAISWSILSASSSASLILLASILTCGFSASTRRFEGLVDAMAAFQAASILARFAPFVTAPNAGFPASMQPHGPPSFSSMFSQCRSPRSASASNAGHDSSNMLRRRFLSLVAQATMWLLWAASDLAASRALVGLGDRQQRVGDVQRRLRDDEGVALVGLGVAPRTAWRPGARRARGTRRPAPPACARDCQQANVATLVDDNDRIACDRENRPSRSPSELRTRLLSATLLARDEACPVRRLADVDAQNDAGGDIADGMVVSFQSSVDRMLLPATPTLPGRGSSWRKARQFSYQFVGNSGARVGNTPRALEGQGRQGRPRASDRQSLRTCVNHNVFCD